MEYENFQIEIGLRDGKCSVEALIRLPFVSSRLRIHYRPKVGYMFVPGKIYPNSSTTLYSTLFWYRKSSKLDKIIYPKPASTLFLVYPTFDLWCIYKPLFLYPVCLLPLIFDLEYKSQIACHCGWVIYTNNSRNLSNMTYSPGPGHESEASILAADGEGVASRAPIGGLLTPQHLRANRAR